MKTNTPATLFNRYRDAAGNEKWRRTVLRDVFWNSSYSTYIDKTGFVHMDALKCFIPGNVDAQGREYAPPKAYRQAGSPDTLWTLAENDRLVKGVVSEDFDDITALEKHYDNVLRVQSAGEKFFGSTHMRHIKVIGR